MPDDTTKREATVPYGDAITPAHRVELAEGNGAMWCHLYMQTFIRSAASEAVWTSTPAPSWPRIATIGQGCICLYPIYTNPYTKRYLTPRHGKFSSLLFSDNAPHFAPATEEAARSQLEWRLPAKLFSGEDDCYGLVPDLDEVWRVLETESKESTLLITKGDGSSIHEGVISVDIADLDEMRRALNRIDRRKRDGVRLAKRHAVFAGLLTKIDPSRFEAFGTTNPEEATVVIHSQRTQRRTASQKAAERASVASVRSNLKTLAADSTKMLMELRAEIELVTLTQMIGKFEELLAKNLAERYWQKFFEENLFVLTLAFARPVQLLQSHFHARGSTISGAGAQIGDFLLREMGQGLAIVEIKRPETPLILSTPYRNEEVFGPSADLSGAVTQVLNQQSHLRSQWLNHRAESSLKQSSPDSIKCVVIVGRSLSDGNQKRSFELFRNACKDVEVITFDELLEKLRRLHAHLAPPAAEDPEVPF